ncbi:MAG: hypothetical protein FWC27_02005 [Firmicutes bacterium]|nr:hypothetical protein [Bacillota bacterium]
MKKLSIIIMAIMLCAGMSMAAHAQNELYEVSQPAVGIEPYAEDPGIPGTAVTVAIEAPIGLIEKEAPVPNLADGRPGTGEIADIAAYWAKNGWPDNISFAYLAGGEMPPYNPDTDSAPPAAISWWEIGMVNADEAARQEILALMSSDCRVTFWDCTWSYKQREAAFNEIYASRDDIIRNALMSLNSEVVFVEIADGYEKEYAKKFIDQYGAFIVITNDAAAAQDAAPALGGILELGGDLDKGGTANHPLGTWFWAVCLIAIAGIAMLAYFNRARLVPAMQTANGNVVTGSMRVSRKQAEAAVKSSAVSPPGDSFKSIMERVDDPQE